MVLVFDFDACHSFRYQFLESVICSSKSVNSRLLLKGRAALKSEGQKLSIINRDPDAFRPEKTFSDVHKTLKHLHANKKAMNIPFNQLEDSYLIEN